MATLMILVIASVVVFSMIFIILRALFRAMGRLKEKGAYPVATFILMAMIIGVTAFLIKTAIIFGELFIEGFKQLF